MHQMSYTGFGGLRLEAELHGAPEDPHVLLVHDLGEGPDRWRNAAEALAAAGRHAIILDTRTSHDLDALAADLRAVLGQLDARPVIVGAGRAGAAALGALGRTAAQLATGLVLAGGQAIDADALAEAAAAFALPCLALGECGLAPLIPGIEAADADALDDPEAFNAALLSFLERRVPRAAPVFREGTDPRTLRDALGCFATGVTIVTSLDPQGEPVGLTANSFTSLSLDPPLLLVCIARTASTAAVLESAPNFAVNVLQIGQQPTSNRFASRTEDRFAATPWEPGLTGVPMLVGSLASFECAREAVHEGGDHFILVGRVIEARFEPQRDPLLYFRGKYRRLHFA